MEGFDGGDGFDAGFDGGDFGYDAGFDGGLDNGNYGYDTTFDDIEPDYSTIVDDNGDFGPSDLYYYPENDVDLALPERISDPPEPEHPNDYISEPDFGPEIFDPDASFVVIGNPPEPEIPEPYDIDIYEPSIIPDLEESHQDLIDPNIPDIIPDFNNTDMMPATMPETDDPLAVQPNGVDLSPEPQEPIPDYNYAEEIPTTIPETDDTLFIQPSEIELTPEFSEPVPDYNYSDEIITTIPEIENPLVTQPTEVNLSPEIPETVPEFDDSEEIILTIPATDSTFSLPFEEIPSFDIEQPEEPSTLLPDQSIDITEPYQLPEEIPTFDNIEPSIDEPSVNVSDNTYEIPSNSLDIDPTPDNSIIPSSELFTESPNPQDSIVDYISPSSSEDSTKLTPEQLEIYTSPYEFPENEQEGPIFPSDEGNTSYEPDVETGSNTSTQEIEQNEFEDEAEASSDQTTDGQEFDSSWQQVDIEDVQTKTGKDTIWSDNPFDRGRTFEELEDANIAGNFPTIDDLNPETGAATSMKTMDLSADTYQDPIAVENKVKEYIDNLSNFEDTTWHQDGEEITVLRDDIQSFNLDLGVPSGKATSEQIDVLNNLQEYAANKGVNLIIKEVP